MKILSDIEARIIGALLEKSITTPELYPLSLNALQNACNQKSSRDPVMTLSEADLESTLSELIAERLIIEAHQPQSRVAKYRQRFCNTEFSTYQFAEAELAIMIVLMLRGPQSAGELRSRTNRLYSFTDLKQVENALSSLATESDRPALIEKLAKEPGKRESRYRLLIVETTLSAESAPNQLVNNTPVDDFVDENQNATPRIKLPPKRDDEDRLRLLEQTVAALKAEVAQIKAELGID